MKPLDFVRTPGGGVAIVTEVGRHGDASITYIAGMNPKREHNAWWSPSQLEVCDSLPRLMADTMAHPFGENKRQGERFFPTTHPTQEAGK